MNFFRTLHIAFRALRRNPLRSGLTSLGIIIGVAAVIAMVSIGNGASARIRAGVAGLGTNLVMVFPGSTNTGGGLRSGAGGASTLMPNDAEAIAANIPGVIAVSPEVRTRTQVLVSGYNWNTQILGESADYLDMRNWGISAGMMFAEDDVRRYAKVAVVGQTIVDQLYGGDSPLGRTIRIGNTPFRVIGVLAPKGYTSSNQDQDDIVIVPYTSHMRRISRRRNVSSILVQISDLKNSAMVQDWIGMLLADRHRITTEPDYRISDQEEITARATAINDTMTMLLGAVAGISLLVGGIGIMNIMLVSVTERTREIGVRLALGAHDGDVLRQFLIEALMVSSVGGIIGVALGVAGSQVLGAIKGWPVEVSVPAIIVAVGFSAFVGIFFGYYPARRAAQMNPIDALRFE